MSLIRDFDCNLNENKEDKSVNTLKSLINKIDLIDLWSKIKPNDKTKDIPVTSAVEKSLPQVELLHSHLETFLLSILFL
jgi:hypothetical protein